MKRNLCLMLSFGLVLMAMNCQSQSFWQLTYEFPGGPKTGISLAGNSCLLVGLENGLIRSCDEGQSFHNSLNAKSVHCLFSSRFSEVFAGGTGKIYRSRDLGETWDSVGLESIYPVTQIIENSVGHLFAITGVLDIDLGFVGDGVFVSDDNGSSWEARNSGLGGYHSCERIAVDKNDRLYLAVADEYVTGNAGLFISDNEGLSWEHTDIRIDGRGVIDDQIKIGNTTGLSVSAADSLYFSFTGVAVNALVTLNTAKHINDVPNNDHWKVYSVFNSISWWLDRPLNNIFFAQNGDWYSSVRGTVNSGGTYFTRKQGHPWNFITDGIGTDLFGKRNLQHFAEYPSGRIFMTQFLDERVYFTDESLLTAVTDPLPDSHYIVYPNPVTPGNSFYVQGIKQANPGLAIYDAYGRIISRHQFSGLVTPIKAPEYPGFYSLVLYSSDHRKTLRLFVLK